MSGEEGDLKYWKSSRPGQTKHLSRVTWVLLLLSWGEEMTTWPYSAHLSPVFQGLQVMFPGNQNPTIKQPSSSQTCGFYWSKPDSEDWLRAYWLHGWSLFSAFSFNELSMRRKLRHEGALPHWGDTNLSLMPPLMACCSGDVLQGSPACFGFVFSALIIISLWHVTATGVTLRKQKSWKAAPAKEQGWMQKEAQGCHTTRTCLQPTVECRQVASKMKRKGRAGRWGRNAQRQWQWPSQPVITQLPKKSFSTHSGLLQMGQPAGAKTLSSTTCLDLLSDVVTIHPDAIFFSTYTDPSIFSVISNPGLRSSVPGSLRKDKVEVISFIKSKKDITAGNPHRIYHMKLHLHTYTHTHLKHIGIDRAPTRILEELKIWISTSWVAGLWAWTDPFDWRLPDVVACLRIC